MQPSAENPIRYFHVRARSLSGLFGGKFTNKLTDYEKYEVGGPLAHDFTVAYFVDPDSNLVFSARAICDVRDRFEKKEGRRVASERLLKDILEPDETVVSGHALNHPESEYFFKTLSVSDIVGLNIHTLALAVPNTRREEVLAVLNNIYHSVTSIDRSFIEDVLTEHYMAVSYNDVEEREQDE